MGGIIGGGHPGFDGSSISGLLTNVCCTREGHFSSASESIRMSTNIGCALNIASSPKVNSRLREWRSGFGNAGLEAVKMWVRLKRDRYLRANGSEPDVDDISTAVLDMLSREPNQEYNKHEEYRKSKRFFWAVWDEDGAIRDVRCKVLLLQYPYR